MDNKPVILVVEDEFTSRKLLMNLLAAYGEVDIAVNGQEAIDAARRALAYPLRGRFSSILP